MDDMGLLISLAKRGSGVLKVSTGELALELGISQQSVSRKLQELEAEGMITRSATPSGMQIQLTQKGTGALEKQYGLLKGILEKRTRQALTGIVLSGMGEGKYYLGMRQYREKIQEKLGFTPYEGTLNIKLTNPEDAYLLDAAKPIIIEGFTTETRTYGSIKSIPVLIAGSIKGAAIRPERTHYGPDVVEIIAQPFLRKKLGLNDGDKIKIEVLA